MKNTERLELCPVWEKCLLTVDEAASYFNICPDKLREMSDGENCRYVLWNGSKRLFKRKQLEEFLDSMFSV